MKPSKEITGFVFQEIPLSEAINAVIAGDGNYSDIKAALLEKLPQIEEQNRQNNQEQKAFSFGLPKNQEVPEDQRRGLCMAVNKTLTKAHVSWHVTYSSMRKVFICVPEGPKVPKGSGSPRGPYKKNSSNSLQPSETMEGIIRTACETFKVTPKTIRKPIGREQKNIRKAVCVVAHDHHVPTGVVMYYVGLPRSGTRFAFMETARAAKEVALLRSKYRG